MVTCKISFENNNSGIFYSGSTINGIVEITVDKPTDVRSIVLLISGEANVRWSEVEEVNDRKTSVNFTANENYINTTTILHGSTNGSTVTISPGTHIYKFVCALPPELPSSIEGYDGRIRYSAKVVFDRPLKFNKTFITGITIIQITDLNIIENPQIRLPSTSKSKKKFWCRRFPNRPLTVEGTIPKSGYVSGECITVSFKLFNTYGKRVQHFSVSLKQLINSQSDNPKSKSKVQTITLTKEIIDFVENTQEEFFQTSLLIPPVPPTCDEKTCRIIQVHYEIHIKVHVSGRRTGPVVEIPLIIGNVPLISNNQIQNQVSQSINSLLPRQRTPEICAAEFGLSPPSYEEPTYIEKVDMNVNEEHPIGESTYLPRYPVFKFNQ
ncbi:arrestin domain-containing protein 17-like isoform X1 [Condylostylus longicornis]|uniref:arrestin domain-containing protein 17-like isoform X1 n=1 Tax=Condylostylus longicornis TaxID=2530218 RepID=UPI00244E3A94|nr:arrestin domain-containing protein 17-like isoform X1 [Condylostylus longicornis]